MGVVVAGWLVVVVVVVVVVGAGVDVSFVPLLATGAAVGGGAGVTTGGVWLLNTSGDGNSQHQVLNSRDPLTVLDHHVEPVLVGEEGLQSDGDGGRHHIVERHSPELSAALALIVVGTLGHVTGAAVVLAQRVVQVLDH